MLLVVRRSSGKNVAIVAAKRDSPIKTLCDCQPFTAVMNIFLSSPYINLQEPACQLILSFELGANTCSPFFIQALFLVVSVANQEISGDQ